MLSTAIRGSLRVALHVCRSGAKSCTRISTARCVADAHDIAAAFCLSHVFDIDTNTKSRITHGKVNVCANPLTGVHNRMSRRFQDWPTEAPTETPRPILDSG